MSSSAFVLQLLQERGEMATRFGSATLGILLLQVRAWELVRTLSSAQPLLECSVCISAAT